MGGVLADEWACAAGKQVREDRREDKEGLPCEGGPSLLLVLGWVLVTQRRVVRPVMLVGETDASAENQDERESDDDGGDPPGGGSGDGEGRLG